MKAIFMSLLVLILCASCSSNATKYIEAENMEGEESESIDTLNIEKFAFEFYRTHKNIANNSITRKEAAKEFQEQFKEVVKNCNIFKGVPMNLRTLKDQHNGKYTAHFWSASIDRDWIAPFDDLNFDIAVTLSKDVAISLVEKSNYLLDVDYIGHITNIDAFQMLIGYNDWVKTAFFELKPNEKDYDGAQTFDIDLGMMLVDFKDIKPYTRQ